MLALATGLTIATASARDRVVSVVRTDSRTGKLVRTVVNSTPPAPKPAAATAAATSAGDASQPDASKPDAAKPVSAQADNPASTAISQTVERIAVRHSLPPQLIHSVIKVESNYNPWAVSPKGAFGLMQLIPATARRFGVSNVFDPEDNINGGAKYLKYLLGLYDGNYTLALAAYNAGEAAVARYGAVPPYPETVNYVRQVGSRLAAQPTAAAQPEPKPNPAEPVEASPAPPPEPAPARIEQIVEANGTVRYVSR
jgi:soluble lytic murein transglycosylase-like protein